MLKSIKKIFEKKNWMYQPQDGEQYFFMHIPKTGGTTFRKILTNHFPEQCYYPTKDDLIENDGKYYPQLEIIKNHSLLLQKTLLIGHFNLEMINYLRKSVRTMTFIREPVSRVLSHVNHLMTTNPNFKGLTPEDIVDISGDRIINLQLKMLGWNNSESLDTVIENLEKFDFVGLTENFNESINLVNGKFNWKLKNTVPQNKSKSNIYNGIRQSTLDQLRKKLTNEITVYNFVKNKYYK